MQKFSTFSCSRAETIQAFETSHFDRTAQHPELMG
jgi:hypothetical protein